MAFDRRPPKATPKPPVVRVRRRRSSRAEAPISPRWELAAAALALLAGLM